MLNTKARGISQRKPRQMTMRAISWCGFGKRSTGHETVIVLARGRSPSADRTGLHPLVCRIEGILRPAIAGALAVELDLLAGFGSQGRRSGPRLASPGGFSPRRPPRITIHM